MKYLQVCQALYDYEARTTDEISIKESDTLYILAKEDDDWWKAELKQASTNGPATIGLVPATYMDEASPIGKVRAEYDYDAQQEEELSFREGQTMWLLECDDPDWYLVKLDNGDIGLSPANYVHAVDQNQPPPPTTSTPSTAVAPPMHTKQHANNNDDEAQSWTVHEYDASKKKKKKGKGSLMVGNAMLCYGSETDKASPVQQYPILSVTKYLFDGKNIHIEAEGPNPAVLDLQASSKSEAKAILVKITESRRAAQAAGTHVSAMATPSSTTTNNTPLITTASEPRWAISLYTFDAEGGEELSITENQQILVTDCDRDDGWWRVETTDGASGVIPSSFVQFYDSNDNAVSHPTIGQGSEDVDSAAHDEVETYMLAKERQQQEDLRQQQQRKVDQQRRDDEERERRRKVQEAAQLAEMTRQRQAEEDRRRRESIPRSSPPSRSTVGGSSSARQDLPKPDPDRLRTWTDRSGTFKVEAQFLAYTDGKLRLHKANGVKIDVPLKKMSAEDIRWVERRTDQPLGSTMNYTAEKTPEMPPRPNPTAASGSAVTTRAKNSNWDWFDWLMTIGIPMQEALVYSSAFKADNLDDSDLTRLTHKQMKMLGMKEKHVQRMERYIDTGVVEPHSDDEAAPPTQTGLDGSKQIETDEEMARRLQKAWNDGTGKTDPPSSRPNSSVSAAKEPHPDLLEFLGSDFISTSTSTSNNKQLQQPTTSNDLIGFGDDAWDPRPSKETGVSHPQPLLQPQQAPPPQNASDTTWLPSPINSNTSPPTSVPGFQQQPVSMQQTTSMPPQQQRQQTPSKTIDPGVFRYQNPSSSPNGSTQQLNSSSTRPSLNQLSQQEELRKYQQQQRQQSLLEQQQQIIMQQQQHIQQQQIQQQQIQLQQQQGQLQQFPMATGYQQPNSSFVLYNNGFPAAAQQQLSQPQMTGYAPTGTMTGLSSAAGQPMYYQPQPPLQPQATGRHWNASTPANPFGSPTTLHSPQMTGAHFSDPSAFTQSPIQQPPGYLQQLQPQMTGIQQTELSGARDKYAAFRTPNADVFTPSGSMQYGHQG